MKVSLIVQARMGSSRLPGKSIMPLAGKPLIYRLIERLKRCVNVNNIILTTPDTHENDILTEVVDDLNIDIFRGSEYDLLDRTYQAAKNFSTDLICRFPGDNPLPEPSEIDKIISHHITLNYTGFSTNITNVFKNGYPDGIGSEVFNLLKLREAMLSNPTELQKEHVHLNFFNYDSQKAINSDWCPISTIKCPILFRRPDIILDVNTFDQYLLIKNIYEDLYISNNTFNINDIIAWFQKKNK
tara:strand:+ start:311 stop:1036 length:726 start_codon:yes stop_codon:yes gene_type:complete